MAEVKSQQLNTAAADAARRAREAEAQRQRDAMKAEQKAAQAKTKAADAGAEAQKVDLHATDAVETNTIDKSVTGADQTKAVSDKVVNEAAKTGDAAGLQASKAGQLALAGKTGEVNVQAAFDKKTTAPETSPRPVARPNPRTEFKATAPAEGSKAAELNTKLAQNPDAMKGVVDAAYPGQNIAVGGHEAKVQEVRERKDGLFEVDVNRVRKEDNSVLKTGDFKETLVVDKEGKVVDDKLSEAKMKELGIDSMPEDTDIQKKFKESTIKSEASRIKEARDSDVKPRLTVDPETNQLNASPSKEDRGIYSRADPAIMEDIKSGGAKGLELERGHKGPGVRETQALLNKFGAGLRQDGMLGPRTEAAIKQFQEQMGLPATGKLDAKTYEMMEKTNPADVPGMKFDLPPRPSGGNPRVPAGERLEMLRKHILENPDIPNEWADDPNKLAAFNESIEGGSGWRSGENGTASFESVSKAGARNQMVEGTITVNGRSYQFRSGGGGKGNLPPGQYTVTKHMNYRGERSMNVGGVGYSFALSDKYDPRVGANRSLLRIHPDGGGRGTIGCIGIVGDAATQAAFQRDMNAEIERNGGRYTLNVG